LQFLEAVVAILLDFLNETNDRSAVNPLQSVIERERELTYVVFDLIYFKILDDVHFTPIPAAPVVFRI
jgi:hypothetical protein